MASTSTTTTTPVIISATITRLPHLSPSAFHARYEKHMELIQSLFGDSFPVVNRRHYLLHDRAGLPDDVGKAPPAVTYDCYTTNVFRDQAHFEQFMERYMQVREAIEEDESAFMVSTETGTGWIRAVEETWGPRGAAGAAN